MRTQNHSNLIFALAFILAAPLGRGAEKVPGPGTDAGRSTRVSIVDGKWHLNGAVTYPGTKAEGLLMNVRMVNAVFEDTNDATRPHGFDAEANTAAFIARIPDYVSHGVRAFTLCVQGGMPGYEGAVNSAFNPDGTLRDSYMKRVRRVIEACDRLGVAVILGCFYQRQDQILRDDDAIRAGVVGVAKWIKDAGYTHVLLEISNEFAHQGFDHPMLKSLSGQAGLIALAKEAAPGLLVSTSGMGGGRLPDEIARASDFLLIHFNNTKLDRYSELIAALQKYGKAIVCNEDEKLGADGAKAAELCVAAGASWGFMHSPINQNFPKLSFNGAADDPLVYDTLKRLTTEKVSGAAPVRGARIQPKGTPNADPEPATYFPPPESRGGWRKLTQSAALRDQAGVDPERLAGLERWLHRSDSQGRNFAAVVIRRGYVVLEIEKGLNSRTDLGQQGIASCAKAVMATALSIVAEESQRGRFPRKLSFDDPAFSYIPWAQPFSDPLKAQIKVKHLLNHTSGIVGEWWQNKDRGVKNHGPWEWILGHTGDWRTEKLLFEPGTNLEYSTHGSTYLASLVCEGATGMPYDQFVTRHLFEPLGIETSRFQFIDGDERHGRHPSGALSLPAREMARIAYAMLRGGRWRERQVIPRWFVEQTAVPTHDVKGIKTFGIEAQVYSHAWELLARRGGAAGAGVPADARSKTGTGAQLIAFIPSLDLVLVRMTGSSGGEFDPAEYLRQASACVLPQSLDSSSAL